MRIFPKKKKNTWSMCKQVQQAHNSADSNSNVKRRFCTETEGREEVKGGPNSTKDFNEAKIASTSPSFGPYLELKMKKVNRLVDPLEVITSTLWISTTV